MLRLEMLPARQGDCILVEYGENSRPHRILIDAGTGEAYDLIRERFKLIGDGQREFDLLVITHVCIDHIGGVLRLLDDAQLGISFKDIWFNGWRHLPGSDIESFGPVDGEKLTSLLLARHLSWNSNERFGGKAVAVKEDDDLPQIVLDGGMRLTLLSPGMGQLKKLRPKWAEECRKNGLDPDCEVSIPRKVPPGYEPYGPANVDSLADSPFASDRRETNGSSIAFLAEYGDRRLLFTGDAFAGVVLQNLKRLQGVGEQERLRLDAFKVSHHGSKANINKKLLDALDCQAYLISTNGEIHQHPNREAVARIIKYGGEHKQLIFNYKTDSNSIWDEAHMKDRFGYTVSYPEPEEMGSRLSLE